MTKDKEHIENSAEWRHWPICPLLHQSGQKGFLVEGLPAKGQFDPTHPGYRTVVIACPRWFFEPAHKEQRLRVERRTYASIDAMLADGWRVSQ